MADLDADSERETSRRDALAERLLGACTGALDLLHVYVGDRLGLYRALTEEAATPAELAQHCGIHER